MNANLQTNDLIQLRSMAGFWGDVFSGTKAQLNAIGFGVGCLFPGEPLAAKRQCKLPLAHGYKKVEVNIFGWRQGSQSDKLFDDRIFDVHAYHLATDLYRREKRMPFASDVTVREDCRGDTYIGTAQALILAGVIEERHLPGMPGCGKCTTTVDTNGSIFTRGSTDWRQQGFKVVRKYGKKLSVYCIVSEAAQELRLARDRQKQHAYELACMEAKQATLAQQSAPRPRPALRLVWSV